MFSWLLSRKCLLCQQVCERDYDLCHACEQGLPRLSSDFYPQISPFHKTIALFHYSFPITYIITQLKFHQALGYANLLGQLLSKHIQQSYDNHPLPELIIPIPLHKKRLRERGFNQALEIAKPIAKFFNIPLDTSSCIRTKNTLPQSTLKSKDRSENIKNAFYLQKCINAKYITLIDDVVTTGQTIRELTKIFEGTSVEKIDIWCCARTTPENKDL